MHVCIVYSSFDLKYQNRRNGNIVKNKWRDARNPREIANGLAPG
jgi:hypothetical protein